MGKPYLCLLRRNRPPDCPQETAGLNRHDSPTAI
jgi:hypothetical protein